MKEPTTTDLNNIANRYITQRLGPGLIPIDVLTVLDVAYEIEENRTADFHRREHISQALEQFTAGRLDEKLERSYPGIEFYTKQQAIRGILDRLAIYCRENPRQTV